jgi:sugar/nucleoside kinase (ribokinase family)
MRESTLSPPEPRASGASGPHVSAPHVTTPDVIDLVIVGDCNPDVLVLGDDVTPVFGQQEKLVPSMSLVVGGSASITAVAAARLGLSVALVAAVGDDPAGQFMLDQMAREGVGADAVAVREDPPTGRWAR